MYGYPFKVFTESDQTYAADAPLPLREGKPAGYQALSSALHLTSPRPPLKVIYNY